MDSRPSVDRHKKVLNRITNFLLEHALEPTPPNYTLAYTFLGGEAKALETDVAEATDGGLRLRPATVERILRKHGLFGGTPSDAAKLLDDAAQALRQQAQDLSTIVENTVAATGQFNHDIAQSAKQISGRVDGGQILNVVQAMVKRAADAETQLRRSQEEIEALRQNLDEARADADTDSLTGLPNRQAANRILQELDKGSAPYSLAFCDIDHFKSINDTYGHPVGDRVLKFVAQNLRMSCAPHTVYRWGGEEFIVVMQAIPPHEAKQIVDGALHTIGNKTPRLRESEQMLGKVTFSAGVATGKGASLIEKADQMLYRAKKQGRNQVVSTPEMVTA